MMLVMIHVASGLKLVPFQLFIHHNDASTATIKLPQAYIHTYIHTLVKYTKQGCWVPERI